MKLYTTSMKTISAPYEISHRIVVHPLLRELLSKSRLNASVPVHPLSQSFDVLARSEPEGLTNIIDFQPSTSGDQAGTIGIMGFGIWNLEKKFIDRLQSYSGLL